jgi:hypothetical protein
MPSFTAPSAEQIDNIASLAEPVLRNLLITQCYCELSAVFAKRMGQGANWCTFATWASKQAGQTVRQEDLRRTLEAMLKNEPEIEVALSLVHTLAKQTGARQSLDQLRQSTIGMLVTAAANHASDAISRGNKKVFEEIGREFSRFITSCINDPAYVQTNIESFCQQLRPGPPPEGQSYLQNAFGCYYLALFEEDAKKKTELNFLANLQIGLHEQNRLQPEITEALDVAAIDLQKVKSKLFKQLFARSNFRTKFRLFFQRIFSKKTILEKAIESLLERIRQHLRALLTTHLMALTLPPHNRLQLGKDLALPYPADLKELANPDLLVLLSKVDPTPNSLRKSGAADWSVLAERMHYIADLFRCYHASNELFDAAFTAEQINALKNRKLPEGEL